MEKQSWKNKNAFVKNPQTSNTITSNQTAIPTFKTLLKPQKFIVLTKPNSEYINHKISATPINGAGKKILVINSLPTVGTSVSGLIKPITHKLPVLPTISKLPTITSIESATNVYKPLPTLENQCLNSMPKKPQMSTSSAQLITVPVVKRPSSTSPNRSPVKKIATVVHQSPVKGAKRSLTPQAVEKPTSKEKMSISKKQHSKIEGKRKDKLPASNGINGEIPNGEGQEKKPKDNKVNGKNTEKLEKLLKETYNNKHVCVMCKKVFDQKKDALLKHFPTCDLFLPLTDPTSDTYIYRKDGYDYITCEYIECQYETPFKENYRKHVIEEHTKNYLHNCYVCSKGFVDKYEKITHNCSKRVRSNNLATGVLNEKQTKTNAADSGEVPSKTADDKREKNDSDNTNTSETAVEKENQSANDNSVEKEKQISNEKDGDNDHSKETKEASSDESLKPLQIDEEEKEVTQNDQETVEKQAEQENMEIEATSKSDNELNELEPENDEMDQEEALSKEVKNEKIEKNLKVDDTSMELEVKPIEKSKKEVCETGGKEEDNRQVETNKVNCKTSDEIEDFARLNLEQLDKKGNRSFFCKYPGCTYVGRLQISFVKHFVFKHQQEKPFQCDECGDQFFSSETRDNHVEEHRYTHSEEEYLGGTTSKSPIPKPSASVQSHPSNSFPVPLRVGGYYSCSVCTYRTRVAKRYKMHSWRHVLNAPFKCPRCELSYKLKREYLFHARICRFFIKNDRTNLKEPINSVPSTSDYSSEINVEDIPVTLRNNASKVDEAHSDTTIDSSDNEMDVLSFQWSNGWVDDEFLRVYGSVESQLGKAALQITESDIEFSSNEDFYATKSKKKQRTKRKYPYS